jgi:hypothetical protein
MICAVYQLVKSDQNHTGHFGLPIFKSQIHMNEKTK